MIGRDANRLRQARHPRVENTIKFLERLEAQLAALDHDIDGTVRGSPIWRAAGGGSAASVAPFPAPQTSTKLADGTAARGPRIEIALDRYNRSRAAGRGSDTFGHRDGSNASSPKARW
jgi:hypothetical protein